MIDGDNPLSRHLWAFLAACAGAITALSFRPFRDMSKWEVTLALFVGASFAIFVGPWAAHLTFGEGPIDIRILGGLFYLLASGSNILIPVAVKKLTQVVGGKDEA